jgi:hypothetical protein
MSWLRNRYVTYAQKYVSFVVVTIATGGPRATAAVSPQVQLISTQVFSEVNLLNL